MFPLPFSTVYIDVFHVNRSREAEYFVRPGIRLGAEDKKNSISFDATPR